MFLLMSCNENFHITQNASQNFSSFKTVLSSTGSSQSITIPEGASTLIVKVWGAGGGGGRGYSNVLNYGGAGAYSEARFNISDLPSKNLVAVVGVGGLSWNDVNSNQSVYLNGGIGGVGDCTGGKSGGGGGLVGLFLDSITEVNALIVSGSGGGSSNSNGDPGSGVTSRGGAGGTSNIAATDGSDSFQNSSVFGGQGGGFTSGGLGGTGTISGSPGSSLTGGNGAPTVSNQCGGGGGAGYFGGGGGAVAGGLADSPGGGGSGHISLLGTLLDEDVSMDISAPNSVDEDYPGSPVGEGGDIESDGGNGHIVLIWE